MNLLTVKNLSKKYRDTYAVKDVEFAFPSQTCIALLGPNGAGKTTILRILAGLLKPTSGEIIFNEHEQRKDFRSDIGYLPQHPVFHEWMTGNEFLIHSGRLALLSKEEAAKRANQLLDKVGISEAKNRQIAGYSGGMKQRLGIAQAIIHKPKLLLLDEPVSSLDPIGRREILNLMQQLKKEMCLLFSTHILTDAEEISDELLLLNRGKLFESGKLSDLRQKYQTATIDIEFKDNSTAYLEKLLRIPSIINGYKEQNTIRLTAEDISKARKDILIKAVHEEWPLEYFSINKASLEELFIKVVNG
ncbi:ABC transporter ATP-binding protein [Virgibacillus halodenitrificans]|uniref:ABC transporter ATP-binding protein n=1 Tax=Virgibacillus halodenitrificans TaxID=1482 RepID=UPI000EF554DF|nr:ABC transporter ATP-binding protein [Virgibacillus halodenitrificans]MCJ0933200.1 ABC transporter ATP-binding protein [Virgibacillus halodenitrificans]